MHGGHILEDTVLKKPPYDVTPTPNERGGRHSGTRWRKSPGTSFAFDEQPYILARSVNPPRDLGSGDQISRFDARDFEMKTRPLHVVYCRNDSLFEVVGPSIKLQVGDTGSKSKGRVVATGVVEGVLYAAIWLIDAREDEDEIVRSIFAHRLRPYADIGSLDAGSDRRGRRRNGVDHTETRQPSRVDSGQYKRPQACADPPVSMNRQPQLSA